MDLAYFKHINLYHALCRFFADLNIPVNYLTETPAAPQAILTDTYNPNNPAHQLMREVYVVGGIDDAIFNRRTAALDPQQLKARDYEGLLIFGVTLQRSGDLPTRSQMAEITRAFNREFHYTPVIIVFSYDHYLSFASCERLPYKQTWREGEKTGKVSILKDVDPAHPHTGHLKILETLKIERSGKQAITSFEALYQYWQRVFSVALLNKRFYQELANWYFWAMDQVSFPDDVEKNPAIRNATSLIRLITRVIFIWFIKEKQLVPDILFDRREMRRILKTFADTPDAHSYYNAILQNLFFGTLNQKMNERRFAEDTQHYVKADHGVKNLLRYQEFFSISAPEVLALFANIPFLNGGLFDCLDKDAADTGKHVFVDGFTRNAAKRAIVPDLLFFRDETIWDLNALYGTKNKTYTVKGLFDILAAYKFTIAENTPIEEEIALDPELLGKVFENLLASYNPETQTTARKQTGSFYTPREIVNYMVDESLIAYLSNALQNSPPGRGEGWVASEVEARLRHLLAYTDAPHQFTDAEVAALMTALHTAKILDPACGSGAFPMGMLHKMVHILTKLDPANVRWRETQRRQAIQETEQAFLLGNKEERDKRLLEINEVFEENASDYGRKLYLIENGIYGVDIQPIAIQISKLRVFISLIVDQHVNPAKENLGVRALPNLETKFVAANTLIGLEKPPAQASLFENKAVMALEEQLKDLRHRYFSAKTRKAKMACQHADRALRQQIAQLLVHDNQWTPESARQLATFDPYDQNAKADFFDPEWMFGLQEGFDIAIGNPPYGATYPTEHKVYFQKYYKSAKTISGKQKGSLDTFSLFIDKGLNLGNNVSVLAYIVPLAITSSEAMTALHNMMFQQCETIYVSTYSNRPRKIFDSADQRVAILICHKNNQPTKYLFTTKVNKRYEGTSIQEVIDNLDYMNSFPFIKFGRLPKVGTQTELSILQKLYMSSTTLADLYDPHGKPVYYRSAGGRYYNIITNFPTGSSQEKSINVKSQYRNLIAAILSSNLYYWFLHIYSDHLHVKSYELDMFPIPIHAFSQSLIAQIEQMYDEYLKDLHKHSKVKHVNYAHVSEYREYYARYSKLIIDKIDFAIKDAYNLTDAEIQFIINYDVIFRTNADEND